MDVRRSIVTAMFVVLALCLGLSGNPASAERAPRPPECRGAVSPPCGPTTPTLIAVCTVTATMSHQWSWVVVTTTGPTFSAKREWPGRMQASLALDRFVRRHPEIYCKGYDDN